MSETLMQAIARAQRNADALRGRHGVYQDAFGWVVEGVTPTRRYTVTCSPQGPAPAGSEVSKPKGRPLGPAQQQVLAGLREYGYWQHQGSATKWVYKTPGETQDALKRLVARGEVRYVEAEDKYMLNGTDETKGD